MLKFTFIFEYNGGTYINQISALTLIDAIRNWADEIGPEIPNFKSREKQQLNNEIKIENPSLLSGLENVWCMVLKIGNSTHLLNIVATISA